jgi:small GTP-binding protein
MKKEPTQQLLIARQWLLVFEFLSAVDDLPSVGLASRQWRSISIEPVLWRGFHKAAGFNHHHHQDTGSSKDDDGEEDDVFPFPTGIRGAFMRAWRAAGRGFSEVTEQLRAAQRLRTAAGSTDDYDHLLKIKLVGDSGIGKTAFMNRFNEGQFDSTYPLPNIGVDVRARSVAYNRRFVLYLQMWDAPSGGEYFPHPSRSQYRGAHVYIVLCDLTGSHGLSRIRQWVQIIQDSCTTQDLADYGIVLVGTKRDAAANRRTVATADAIALAHDLGLRYVETSAKTGDGVDRAVEAAVDDLWLKSDGFVRLVDSRAAAAASFAPGLGEEDESDHPPTMKCLIG